jgi:hypothetical protein
MAASALFQLRSKTGMQGTEGSPPWEALESHSKKIRDLHLRESFADDPTRGDCLTASAAAEQAVEGIDSFEGSK